MLGLLEGILTGTAVEDKHHIVRRIGHELLHHALNLRKLVHEAFLVVQTARSIDEDDVGSAGNCAVQRIEGHAGWVAAHLLLHDRYPYPFGPDAYLLDSSGAERISCSKHDLQASLFELIGELADSGRLAHAVHADDEDDIRPLVCRNLKALGVVGVVFREQLCDFIAKNVVQLAGGDVLVARHSFLDSLDDVEGRLNAHIARHEHFLEVVEHLIIHLRLACDGTRQFAEETFLRLLEPLVERFLLLFGKEIKESHLCYLQFDNLQFTC